MPTTPQIPQLFHEAVRDYLNALDASVDKIAPFSGLHPQQLRRLGTQGHHTLAANSLDRLIEAARILKGPDYSEVLAVWEEHLRIASVYTILVVAAHRRTNAKWPAVPDDYSFVWKMASDLVIYSGGKMYMVEDGGEYKRNGFISDAFTLYFGWAKNQVESEEDIRSTLAKVDSVMKSMEDNRNKPTDDAGSGS